MQKLANIIKKLSSKNTLLLVGELGACYLTHVFQQDSRGITIANEIYDAIRSTELLTH